MGRKKEETSIVRHRKVCTEVEINLFVDLSVNDVSRTVRRLINQSYRTGNAGIERFQKRFIYLRAYSKKSLIDFNDRRDEWGRSKFGRAFAPDKDGRN